MYVQSIALNTQLQNTQSEFNSLKEASRQAASELLKTGNKGNTSFLNIGKAAEAAKKVVGGVASVAGKVKTAMGNMANKAGKAFSKLTMHTKKSNSALSRFGNTVKQLALSMVVFQVISKTFNAMVESIKSGIQNYAKYSDKFNESIPRLANGGITTGSTLANIGEAGREAVLPLENNTGWMDDLASKLASKMPDYSGAKTVVLAVDGKEFARINLPYLQDEEIRLPFCVRTPRH